MTRTKPPPDCSDQVQAAPAAPLAAVHGRSTGPFPAISADAAPRPWRPSRSVRGLFKFLVPSPLLLIVLFGSLVVCRPLLLRSFVRVVQLGHSELRFAGDVQRRLHVCDQPTGLGAGPHN